MFNEINTPYSWEVEFYEKNNISIWECKTHETKDLGKIYGCENGSYIKAKVTPMPAQFWIFVVYCADDKKTYHISTGSGELENYFNFMKQLADNIIVVKLID